MAHALRPVRVPADDAFLEALFASTREAELAALPADPSLRATFLRQQYAAHRANRAGRWAGAAHEVISIDGEAVGAIVVDRTGEPWHLVDIALLPGARGAGTGTAVLEALAAAADAAGRTVELHVAPWNPARALYGRLGFVPADGEGDGAAMRLRREPLSRT